MSLLSAVSFQMHGGHLKGACVRLMTQYEA